MRDSKINTGSVPEKNAQIITSLQRGYIACFEEKIRLDIIDTPPEDSPLTWAADEAAVASWLPFHLVNMIMHLQLISVDDQWAFQTIAEQGWKFEVVKVLAVNVDDKSPYEKIVLDNW